MVSNGLSAATLESRKSRPTATKTAIKDTKIESMPNGITETAARTIRATRV